MYMLLMVLDDATRLADVLEAWTSAGVQGVTILESTGLQRIIRRREAGSMFMGFSRLFEDSGIGHNTLFALIDSPELAEAAVAATEAVLGDLRQPNTGIVFTIPVAQFWGLPEQQAGDDNPSTGE